jgi:hypothetical protein
LPPRQLEGGTDGYLTTEATMVKRKAIAADMRQDAEHLADSSNPVPQLMRLMESLVYDDDPATTQRVEKMAAHYVESLAALPSDQLSSKKDEVKNLSNAFKYLARFKILPTKPEPATALEKLIKDQSWDKKKSS